MSLVQGYYLMVGSHLIILFNIIQEYWIGQLPV